MKTEVEWIEELIECGANLEQIKKCLPRAKEIFEEQRIKAYQLGYDTGYKVCEMKFNGLFKSE
jgi:hypothetical protein